MTVAECKQQALEMQASSPTMPCEPDLTLPGEKTGPSHFGLQPDAPRDERGPDAATSDGNDQGAEETQNKRRYDRVTVLWHGRILCDEDAADCVIINISAEGAMVQCSQRIAEDATAILSNDRLGSFAGTVKWKNDHQIGIKFIDDPSKVAEALGKIFA